MCNDTNSEEETPTIGKPGLKNCHVYAQNLLQMICISCSREQTILAFIKKKKVFLLDVLMSSMNYTFC